MQFRVPIDDENTLHVSVYTWRGAPDAVVPAQDVVPYREVPLKDDEGRWIADLVFNQDFMAWASQGPVARRELEKLGESDTGIIMFRKMLREQMDVVDDGGDPMCVFREQAPGEGIKAPLEQVKFGQRRPKKYIPGEAGYSSDADKINSVLATWAALDESAMAPAAGEGEDKPALLSME